MKQQILDGAWLVLAGACALGCSSSDDSGEPTPPDDPMMTEDDPMPPPDEGPDLALDECGLDTGYAGDQYCILPPPESEGFQIHYGPADYDDPTDVATYLLDAGGETNIFTSAVAGNADDVYFYKRQYRMRPGSHHLIVAESGSGSGSLIGMGRRLGGSQNVAKDNPSGEMPPENVGIGMPLSANAPLTLNLHHFNGSGETILKEAWVNFWYVDADSVTQQANEMFLWVQGSSVEPGASDTVVGTWDITSPGRVLTMYGHRHSNNVRFSAYRTRGETRELVLEDYDWEEPMVLEFNTLAENPAPDPASLSGGGHNGILELEAGDKLEWECEIVNARQETITFGENEAATSEMCILVGDAVGPELLGFTF